VSVGKTARSDDGAEINRPHRNLGHVKEFAMLTKTALIVALTLGTVAVASADEFDPNLGNRYPTYNGAAVTQGLQTRSVALTGSPRALINNESYLEHASKSWDGGGF